MIAQEKLKELLHYDPVTGIFTWLSQASNGINIGHVAGRLNVRGCVEIGICGIVHKAHRLAWLYMTGEWPKEHIDHINGVRNDNRWGNLREATRVINSQNRHKAQRNNITGFLGVSRSGKGFMARIKPDKKKQIYLGTFPTPLLAYKAYLDAKRKLHDGCTI